MPLSSEFQEKLRGAIDAYAFPAVVYDFTTNIPQFFASMAEVESRIKEQLKSGDPSQVMGGLSNVLYWGLAQNPGLQAIRVDRFRSGVTATKLEQAAQLFRGTPPSVCAIKKVGLPEFSGLSFVSKIRMFLDPEKSAVLDMQILKMNEHCSDTILAGISIGSKETTIRITEKHARVYEAWCVKLSSISKSYFHGNFRAVDVERGFFQLIQEGEAGLAASILRDA